jgi:hypothetical protein
MHILILGMLLSILSYSSYELSHRHPSSAFIIIGSGEMDWSGDRKKASKEHLLARGGRDRALAMVTRVASLDGHNLDCEGQLQEVGGREKGTLRLGLVRI